MIKEIAFVFYPVTDMARARDFYEKMLGLQPGEIVTERWMEYEIAGGTFAITNVMEDSEPANSLALETDDLDAEVARLKGAGVSFKNDIFESPVCRMAVIEDPDGNGICLHQRKAASA